MLGGCVLALALSFPASGARAARPACFPERTVMFAAEVRDEQGRVLGGVRAGQVVRLLDDNLGRGRAEALIEVQAPARLRGFVPLIKLHVFLRRDQELDPGWVWRLAETPVRIVGRAGQAVLVTWTEGHGHDSSYPPQKTSCRDLTGKPPGKLDISGCSGAWPNIERKPAGERAHLDDDVQVLRGPENQHIRNGGLAGLIRTNGDEALVEVIDAAWFFEPQRIRAWVDRKAVTLGPPTSMSATGHGCCEGWLRGFGVGQPGAALTQDVDLRVEPSAAPFVRVPKGSRFRILDRGEGQMRRIVFMWPGWDSDTYQAEVAGWAPVAVLPPVEKPRWQRAVFGRLRVADGRQPADFTGYHVGMFDSHERVHVEGKVAPDGRFEIWVPSPKGMDPSRLVGLWGAERVDAASPDGVLAGAERATPLLGGDEDVTVTLHPSVKIAGRLKNTAGAWLPGERVEVAAAGYGTAAATTTDAQGRFAFNVAPGRYLVVSEHPDVSEWVTPPALGVELARRRPGDFAYFGSVATPAGGCAAREVNVRCSQLSRIVRVHSDCTFVVTEMPEENCTPAFDVEGVGAPANDRIALWREDHRGKPVCVYGSRCPGEWRQGSLYVSVAGADHVLTRAPATVEVKVPSGAAQGCQTVNGGCYLHHLPPAGTVTVGARQGNRTGATDVELAAGIAEALVVVR